MTDRVAAVTGRGGCLCGAITYQVTGPLRPVIACHCRQCRRSSGHYMAATGTRPGDLAIHDTMAQLRWYRSSQQAERGFCGCCGSHLFWRASRGDFIGIWAGSLEAPTGLQVVMEIGTADAGDYYELDARLPSIAGYAHGIALPDADE